MQSESGVAERQAADSAAAVSETQAGVQPGADSETKTGMQSGVDSETELRIFVDRSSVEVFEGGGRLVMTDLIFPSGQSDRLSVFAGDESTVFRFVRISRIAGSNGEA
jgi:sucrose-6-phosphate hydrolase SacC (GH32 family)